MTQELDDLMAADPLSLTSADLAKVYEAVADIPPDELSPRNIDQIIAYQRRRRADLEAGVKPKKESGPKQSIDLVALGLIKPTAPVKRRF